MPSSMPRRVVVAAVLGDHEADQHVVPGGRGEHRLEGLAVRQRAVPAEEARGQPLCLAVLALLEQRGDRLRVSLALGPDAVGWTYSGETSRKAATAQARKHPTPIACVHVMSVNTSSTPPATSPAIAIAPRARARPGGAAMAVLPGDGGAGGGPGTGWPGAAGSGAGGGAAGAASRPRRRSV